MKKLLKSYGLNSDMQYFEMIIESKINGQREQSISQFKAMPKDYKKSFIKSALGNWESGLSAQELSIFVAAL